MYYASLYIENWIGNFRLWLSFNTRQPFNFVERKISMRICEIVNDATWVNLLQLAGDLEQKEIVQPIKSNKSKHKEQLTNWELKELMGMNRSTYYKSGGKIKQR